MREVITQARVSPRVVSVCLALGLTLRRPRHGTTPRRIRVAAREIVESIRASNGGGAVVCVTGPSGGGKSTLLRVIARRLRVSMTRRGVQLASDLAAVDTVRGGGATLARAGLADGAAMIRRACELSEGQRHRVQIAQSMGRRARVVLIDEFASTLDRATAMGVAMGLGKWARASRKVVLCATAHDDVIEWLGADIHVRVPLEGEIAVERSRRD